MMKIWDLHEVSVIWSLRRNNIERGLRELSNPDGQCHLDTIPKHDKHVIQFYIRKFHYSQLFASEFSIAWYGLVEL